MPGQAPKPTALKELAGNPGQRPLNHNEPKPVQELYPEPPEHMNLNERARRIWDILIPDLVPLGLATRIDKTRLALYCIFFDQILLVQAQLAALPSYAMPIIGTRPQLNRQTGCYLFDPVTREILKETYVEKTVTVPQFHQQLKLSQEMRKIEGEFGLTPAARTRINVQLKEPNGGTARVKRAFSIRERRRNDT